MCVIPRRRKSRNALPGSNNNNNNTYTVHNIVAAAPKTLLLFITFPKITLCKISFLYALKDEKKKKTTISRRPSNTS